MSKTFRFTGARPAPALPGRSRLLCQRIKGNNLANPKANVEGQIEELSVTVRENIVTCRASNFPKRSLRYDRTFHVEINSTTFPDNSDFNFTFFDTKLSYIHLF